MYAKEPDGAGERWYLEQWKLLEMDKVFKQCSQRQRAIIV